MVKSYRCAYCDANWPHVPAFRTCPICGGETAPDKDLRPDEGAHARATAYKNFREYEAKQDAARMLLIAELDEQFPDSDERIAVEREFYELDDTGKGTN